MESKKHPKANLEIKRGIFFQIGLVIAIGITLLAFEWKTYETHIIDEEQENVDLTVEEMMTITFQRAVQPPPPPPPPSANPDVMDLVDEYSKPVENPEPQIFNSAPTIEILEVPEVPIVEEVIYGSAERMPTFPGCEVENSEIQKQRCTSAKLMKFLAEQIKYPAISKDAGVEGKVFISFVIDSEGEVKNVELLQGVPNGAPLDREAIRVVKKLPNFNPGKQRGKSVSVRYTLPVNFALR